MSKFTITKTKKLILAAMFLSILLVLSRFLSIKTSFLVISFSFIPMMLCGVYLGPKYSLAVAALGDLIGALIFPFGAYFPGFTITAGLMGFIYGIFLYKNPNKEIKDKTFIFKLILSSLIVQIGVKVVIESAFLNIMYGKAYIAVILTRITTQAIMLPIQVITIYLLEKALRPFAKKYIYEEETMNIDEYLNTFSKFTKDPNLDAMKYLMEKFDNPQKKLKIVHVAGTNGKGSICEMLASVLENTEYKVGKFISPHLIRFNDGIYINNKEITDEEVEEILIPLSKEIANYNKTHKVPVKWFEAITSLSLIYFAKNNCDIAILETGLGGTNDCTNIVDSMISIIGNIGYDHVDILGSTIEEIATHKAGIIKENSDTVFVKQEECVNSIIENTCREKNATLHLVNSDEIQNYSYTLDLQKFDYKEYKNVEINLKGKAQINNAAEVLECIDILKNKGYKISKEAIYNGLKTVVHKARLETLSQNPVIIFDGGHNENAINNLRQNVEQYFSHSKKVYIISLLKTKDYKTIIKNICKEKDSIFIFTSGNDKKRYVSKEKLYKEAKKYLNDINMYKYELKDAINICKKAYSDRVILIVGSFYVYKTVCEVLKND